MPSDRMRTSGVVALALVVGTFFTAEEVFMDLAGRRPQLAGRDVVNGLEFWVVWAFLTPAVLAATRRWPLDAKPVARPLFTHLVIAVGLAALHNVISLGIQTLAFHLQDLRGGASVVQTVARIANGTAFVW